MNRMFRSAWIIVGLFVAFFATGCACGKQATVLTKSDAPQLTIPSVGFLDEVGTLEYLESIPEETNLDLTEFSQEYMA